jgi:hypothetical protein
MGNGNKMGNAPSPKPKTSEAQDANLADNIFFINTSEQRQHIASSAASARLIWLAVGAK